ncbi:MAG TPA: histidine kinase, partial [Ignavibacteria bacterium]
MKFYDFVFSNQRPYRLRRHLVFWTTWCIYLILTYLIPTNWIPAWNLRGPVPHIEKYGIALACLRILSAAILLVVVHMGLVYGILYFILPRYLSKNKNPLVTTSMLLLLLSVIAFINYFNFVLSFYLSTRVGYFATMPRIDYIIPRWGRQILFNYPTVVGFALAIKLLKDWYLKQKETAEVAREKINAELQLLKAQVHPHFLFNTLNNIYSFIINNSPAAPEALKKLSTLLRYIIYECNQPLVKLEKELKMLRGYIDLEKIRYGESFNMSLQIQGSPSNKMICPLLLIPFLENSFKHGASQMLTHPWINL